MWQWQLYMCFRLFGQQIHAYQATILIAQRLTSSDLFQHRLFSSGVERRHWPQQIISRHGQKVALVKCGFIAHLFELVLRAPLVLFLLDGHRVTAHAPIQRKGNQQPVYR